ncbi:hypothetical protein ASD37_25675 [Mycobacterium sp. Root135]|nr:hypothetical protein ASD37_25675 [Mycobacterium sp. Root135]
MTSASATVPVAGVLNASTVSADAAEPDGLSVVTTAVGVTCCAVAVAVAVGVICGVLAMVVAAPVVVEIVSPGTPAVVADDWVGASSWVPMVPVLVEPPTVTVGPFPPTVVIVVDPCVVVVVVAPVVGGGVSWFPVS